MTRNRRLYTTLTFMAATALAGVAVSSAPALAELSNILGGPIVNTVDGPVRGITKNGVNEFLGIPYAAPPVGALCWRPPAPASRHGLLDATEFANSCPQVTELGAFAGAAATNEDCLYLNVFTTGKPLFGGLKPVIVWIHGGGNKAGFGARLCEEIVQAALRQTARRDSMRRTCRPLPVPMIDSAGG